MTGIVTASWISLIFSGSLMRATPPSRADVGRHALERHDGAGAGVFGDARLLGVDDVHDDAALQHLGQARLDPQRPVLGHVRSLAMPQTSTTPVDTGCGVRPNCGISGVEIAWRRSCPSARCGIGTGYRRDSSPRRRFAWPRSCAASARGPPTRVSCAVQRACDCRPFECENADLGSSNPLKRDCCAIAGRSYRLAKTLFLLSSGSRPEPRTRAEGRCGCTASATPSRPARSPSPPRSTPTRR